MPIELRHRFRFVRQKLATPVLARLAPAIEMSAAAWRRALTGATFVAVTGSLGKTTAKELIAAALRSRHRTFRSYRNANSHVLVAWELLHVRPWHRVAVIEVSASAPGMLAGKARLVRPAVAVIVSVARTHTTRFADLEETAAEKAQLLSGLAPGGVAVLNGDDPRVAAMAAGTDHRVVTFGTSPGHDLWASEIQAEWPDRLSLVVHDGDQRVPVTTRLVGAHWVPAVLSAILVAREFGVPLAEAAAAIADVDPFNGRLEPIRLPSGAVVLRDDYNGSIDSLQPALEVLRRARARRRVLILSDFSDLRESFRGRFRLLARILPGCVDAVVLFGEHAAYGRRRLLEASLGENQVVAVPTLPAAAELLGSYLEEGDVALLRGRSTDHATRLLLAQFGPITCWKTHCRLTMLCDICTDLGAGRATLRAARAAIVPPPPTVTTRR